MKQKSKKLWLLVMLLALDFALLVLISSANAQAVHLGCNGERVLAVQKKLEKAGFLKNTADGSFSLETRSALKKFQKANNIEASGETDYQTLDALKISSRTALCFTAEAELLARCIQQSGCHGYHEMLEKGCEILRQTNGISTIAYYAANNFSDNIVSTDEPSCQAYSAAVQAIGIFSQQTDSLF